VCLTTSRAPFDEATGSIGSHSPIASVSSTESSEPD
jgi:hypothetical protein